jgi:hypothetical protein
LASISTENEAQSDKGIGKSMVEINAWGYLKPSPPSAQGIDMDSEAAKPGSIALVMFIVYTALVFERLYRESSRPHLSNLAGPGAPRKKAGRQL